ncbi:MAG: hypothetical protein ACJ8EK_18105 [Bradyrhizobium sp.]
MDSGLDAAHRPGMTVLARGMMRYRAQAPTHTPCRLYGEILFDDFLANYALWLWVPHRASLVRDDGGGLVCRHCERSEAIHASAMKLDCFAALAITVVGTAGKS